MHGKSSLIFSVALISACLFGTAKANAYTLSTGAVVDSANLPPPRQSGNGAAAEKWCAEEGKRLPTIEELREMYEHRNEIGGFTNGFDAGGWPYWSQRVTTHPTEKISDTESSSEKVPKIISSLNKGLLSANSVNKAKNNINRFGSKAALVLMYDV